MSYHTILQIENIGDEPIDIDELGDQILTMLDRDGIHHDLLSDLQDAFETGEGVCSVHSGYLLELLGDVAAIAPQANFSVRCLGEEFRHTWIREFSEGMAVFVAGPWDYDQA